VVVPEETLNLFKSPSFENTDADTEVNSGNVTATYDSSWQFRGVYSRKISLSDTNANYFGKNLTANVRTGYLAHVDGSLPHSFSVYVYSPQKENFTLEARIVSGNTLITSKSFTTTGGIDRLVLPIPANVFFLFNDYSFRIVKTTPTTNPYWTDAWQIEAKSYPTTYCDGDQSGCVWLGTPQQSPSRRPLGAPGGRYYNFTDLGIRNMGFVGAGMPPIQHTSTKRALNGGDFYQRGVPTFRVVSISCAIEGKKYWALQSKKQTLIRYFAPDNIRQQDPDLTLVFQTTDVHGNSVGKAVEMLGRYLGGLEGNTDNLVQEKFTLQVTEYSPPSIQEQVDKAVLPSYQVGGGVSTESFFSIRHAANGGQWDETFNTSQAVNTIAQDGSGNVWYGTAPVAGVANVYTLTLRSVTGGPASLGTADGDVFALAPQTFPTTYAGGAFANMSGVGTSYIAYRDSGGLWNALAAGGPNDIVRALLTDSAGKIYTAGDFTTPNNRFTRYNPATPGWESIGGTGLNDKARCLALGLDGKVYIGGDFTTANGATVNYIVCYNPTTDAFSALSTGMNGAVYALAIGPDGRLYAAGNFTTAGGVACNHIAAYNGTGWQPLGVGLNGNVKSISIGPDGFLYAAGDFTGTGDGAITFAARFAKYYANQSNQSNGQWYSLGIGNGSGVYGTAILAATSYDTYIGVTTVAAGLMQEAVTSVNYQGSAGTRPRITVRGPGALYSIVNNTTGAALYFNYTLQTGEAATLNPDPDNLSFISTIRGNVLGTILPGSNLAGFGLIPGNNDIAVLIAGTTGGTTAIEMTYRNTHWSFDASGEA
jgi:hypothetical protein